MKFREARLKAGKTVKEVMEALNVSDAAVYLWETGETRPKLDNLMKLAALYGCTIDDLIFDDKEGSESEP